MFGSFDKPSAMKITSLPLAYRHASQLVTRSINDIYDTGTDEDWEKILEGARTISQQFSKAEREAFQVVLKSRSFFQDAQGQLKTLPALFDAEAYEEVHDVLVEMSDKLETMKDSLQSLTLLVEATAALAEELIVSAIRQKAKYEELAKDMKQNGELTENQRTALFAVALISGPAMCIGGLAGVSSALVVSALSSLGTHVADQINDERVALEVQRLESRATQYGMGQAALSEVNYALKAFQGTLDSFNQHLTDAVGATGRMRGSLSGRRRQQFHQRVEFAQAKFQTIVDGYTTYIDAYVQPRGQNLERLAP